MANKSESHVFIMNIILMRWVSNTLSFVLYCELFVSVLFMERLRKESPASAPCNSQGFLANMRRLWFFCLFFLNVVSFRGLALFGTDCVSVLIRLHVWRRRCTLLDNCSTSCVLLSSLWRRREFQSSAFIRNIFVMAKKK